MDHFALLTPHEQHVETTLHIGGLNLLHKRLQLSGTFCRGFMELSVDHRS